MRVITAPETYNYIEEYSSYDIRVFLAGGITNCIEWQDQVISELRNKKYTDIKNAIIFNPRRKNFPIDDPTAADKQIEWEFNAIENCDIFSMYFCSGISDQPICMYELGRNICRMREKFPETYRNRIVISVEDGYRRAKDVEVQTRLAFGKEDFNIIRLGADPVSHADKIFNAILKVDKINAAN